MVPSIHHNVVNSQPELKGLAAAFGVATMLIVALSPTFYTYFCFLLLGDIHNTAPACFAKLFLPCFIFAVLFQEILFFCTQLN